VSADRRPTAVRPRPAHAFTEREKQVILEMFAREEYASVPPGQLVPRLADEGLYIGSESTMYRVLKEDEQLNHRGKAQKPREPKPKSTHCATGPNEVWCWDVTWLPGPARGLFFYLYLILDLYSRKIVGWEVYERESGEHSCEVVERAVWSEKCIGDAPLVLHGDNGSPLKASAVRVMLQRLGITPSYSRPRVSDDNAYSEALFRTCKYMPDFPRNGFVDIETARQWVMQFVDVYNTVHRHSGIKFVTPDERHRGLDEEILARRADVYEVARQENPARWTGTTRDWSRTGAVWLNPERDTEVAVRVAA